MKQLIYGQDQAVANWTLENFGVSGRKAEMIVGIVDQGQIVGSIMWHSWRMHDIEISYYGPDTMTLGIARHCARVAIDHFGVSRVTACTPKSNKTMTRKVGKIGFQYEGVVHARYGDEDGVMYGLYGINLARLAGKGLH